MEKCSVFSLGLFLYLAVLVAFLIRSTGIHVIALHAQNAVFSGINLKQGLRVPICYCNLKMMILLIKDFARYVTSLLIQKPFFVPSYIRDHTEMNKMTDGRTEYNYEHCKITTWTCTAPLTMGFFKLY